MARKRITPVNDQVAWKGRPMLGGHFEAPPIVDEPSLTDMDWSKDLIDAPSPTLATNRNSRGRAIPVKLPKG